MMLLNLTKKSWGSENIIARTNEYIVKRKVILPEEQAPPKPSTKYTTIYVLSGELHLSTGTSVDNILNIELTPGSYANFGPGESYALGAREEPVVLLEVTTPNTDKIKL